MTDIDAGGPVSVDLLSDPAGVPRARAMLQRDRKLEQEALLLPGGFDLTR